MDNRDKLTLRISKELNAETKAEAEYIGASQNNFLLVLINLGLKCYKANPNLAEVGFPRETVRSR